jgi:hypothetical protein
VVAFVNITRRNDLPRMFRELIALEGSLFSTMWWTTHGRESLSCAQMACVLCLNCSERAVLAHE